MTEEKGKIVIEDLDDTGTIEVGDIQAALAREALEESMGSEEKTGQVLTSKPETSRFIVNSPSVNEKRVENEAEMKEENKANNKVENRAADDVAAIAARMKRTVPETAPISEPDRTPRPRPEMSEGRRRPESREIGEERAAKKRRAENGTPRAAEDRRAEKGTPKAAENRRAEVGDPKRPAYRQPESGEKGRTPESRKPGEGGGKKKKNRLVIVAVLLLLLILCAGGVFFYLYKQHQDMTAYYQNRFLPGTTINNVDVAGMTVQEVTDFFSQEAKNYTLTIIDRNGQTDEITASEISLDTSFDISFQEILDSQDPAKWKAAEKNPVNYEAGSAWSFDEVLLTKRVAGSPLFQNMTESSDAEIVYNETTRVFELKEAVAGTKVDVKQIQQLALNAVHSVQHELNLMDCGCYPIIKESDEAMKSTVTAMNKYTKGTVDLLFDPEPKESLPVEVLKEAMVMDASYNITINPEPIEAWVKSLAEKYNTLRVNRTFESTDSGTVTLANDGTYGWDMDVEQTLSVVLEAINSGVPYEGEAYWDSKAASHKAGADFGDTYVEVDLNEQRVYFYQNGNIEWSSNCVSGCPAKGHHTVTGVYYVYSKDRNRTLRGAQADDGTYAYQSFVSYWMPFYYGYGLHDASWRGDFGGMIYKYSGSHGCVNLPYSKAASLYDLVSVGTPVIVFGGIADFGTDVPYTGQATTESSTVPSESSTENPSDASSPESTEATTPAPTTPAPTTPEATTPAPTTPAPTTPEATTPAPTTPEPTTPEATTPEPTPPEGGGSSGDGGNSGGGSDSGENQVDPPEDE